MVRIYHIYIIFISMFVGFYTKVSNHDSSDIGQTCYKNPVTRGAYIEFTPGRATFVKLPFICAKKVEVAHTYFLLQKMKFFLLLISNQHKRKKLCSYPMNCKQNSQITRPLSYQCKKLIKILKIIAYLKLLYWSKQNMQGF